MRAMSEGGWEGWMQVKVDGGVGGANAIDTGGERILHVDSRTKPRSLHPR